MTPEDEKRKRWRVGTKVPRNLYCGDEPIAMLASPELAVELAEKLNRGEDLESRLQAAEAGLTEISVTLSASDRIPTDEICRRIRWKDQENERRLETQATLFGDKIDKLEAELERVKQDLEKRIRKPCYANREGVKCTAEVFYLCFHCKQWFCDTHGLLHFGPEENEKRPTTCLLEKIESLQQMLSPDDIAAGRVLRGHKKSDCKCRYCSLPRITLTEVDKEPKTT